MSIFSENILSQRVELTKSLPLLKYCKFFYLGSHGDMEKAIPKTQSHTHKTILEPFLDCFKIYLEIYIFYVLIKLFEVHCRSSFVRHPFKFWYYKVWTKILSTHMAHLANSSSLKKCFVYFIEYIRNFGWDGEITCSDSLPRSLTNPRGFVISLE